MKNILIHKSKTHFADPMILEYLEGDRLKEFSELPPSKDSYTQAIANRKEFPLAKRRVLAEVLREQYGRSGIEWEGQRIGDQIQALEKEDTFTVTTGQQIHVGLGPLYVLYKIIDVLKLAQDIEQEAQTRIIPVFWMASEDHDLEEVQNMSVFGKEFTWETPQSGAVGRMHTDGLKELIEQVKEQFRWDQGHLDFLDLLSKGYELPNYADATRFILHQLFGTHGLVILDADDIRLKRQFKSVMLNELKGDHISFFSDASSKLKDMGFSPQIHIHSCNLFHLDADDRVKIENQEDRAHKGLLIAEKDAETWMDENYGNCSPNVALRPLYQEMILPNLLYVGGNAEIKYWLQLGPIFKNYAQPMPVLWPRTSYVVLPNAIHKSLDSNDLSKYYLDLASFSEVIAQELGEKRKNLHDRLDTSMGQIAKLAHEFEALVKGVTIEGKVRKVQGKLVEIQEFIDSKIEDLMRNDPNLKKGLKVKDRYFSAQAPQERKEHWISYPELTETLLCQEKWNPTDNLLNINHLLLGEV